MCVALFYYTDGTTGLDPIFHLNYVAGCAGPPLFLKRLFQFSAYYYCAVRNRFQSPYLVYRTRNCPVVLLIFLSGKVVITGAKSTKDVEDGWRSVWPIVKQYIVDTGT